MSKLSQIELAIKALDGATFQRLADAYLHRIGYEAINPIGLVFGAAKTTSGTPDTLVPQEDGRFVFVESTTQQTGLEEKFSNDIAKCLDTEKTGIPIAKISEIILCHSSKLLPEEIHRLAELTSTHSVPLKTIGLGQLAHDLYQKFPSLAHDILGIEVTTGQILSPADFVAAYGRTALSTPLNTGFHFRESELAAVAEQLERLPIVLLTGRAGVGKSRLALEAASKYAGAHEGTRVLCVFNRGADLFQDLRDEFSAPGHYLVLVDDANRITRFEYIAELLRDNVEGRTIKILATVRDYALDQIQSLALKFGAEGAIFVVPLSDEQIRILAKEEFGIVNDLYLRRIAEIAQGNARLAVMACRVASAGGLQSLTDVSSLYDEYFRSIKEDLSNLGDPAILQVGALISFFRSLDRTNQELVGSIADSFGVSAGDLWAAVKSLHDVEILDMYENQVVRVSDQLLATYLFYVACFQANALDFTQVILAYFPKYRRRFVDTLAPVLSAFNSKHLADEVRRHVMNAKNVFQQRAEIESLVSLFDMFGLYVPGDALLAAQEVIEATEEIAATTFELPKESSATIPSASPLSILAQFAHAEERDRELALELVAHYVNRRPADLPVALHVLNESFGITMTSRLQGFAIQQSVVQVLAKKGKNEPNSAGLLLLGYLSSQLQTRFNRFEHVRGRTFNTYNFDLPPTKTARQFRDAAWTEVLALYALPEYRPAVLTLIDTYVGAVGQMVSGELVEGDAPHLKLFFRDRLSPQNYSHCSLVNTYLDGLASVGVPEDGELRKRFAHPTYALSTLFSVNPLEQARDWEAYQEKRKGELTLFGKTLDATTIQAFLTACVEIRKTIREGNREWQFQTSLTHILRAFASKDMAAFASALLDHLAAGNLLGLGSLPLVSDLISALGPEGAFARLDALSGSVRERWLSGFFVELPDAAIDQEMVDRLRVFYSHAESENILHRLGFLAGFEVRSPGIVADIVRSLIEKSGTSRWAGNVVGELFDCPDRTPTKLFAILSSDVVLLEDAYFAAASADPNVDWNGAAFERLLNLDFDFAAKWVRHMYARKQWPTYHDDPRQYDFIWRRKDAGEIMTSIIAAVQEQSRPSLGIANFLLTFFQIVDGTPDVNDLALAQDAFLVRSLTNKTDTALVALIFEIIAELPTVRKAALIKEFLAQNQDFELFRRLRLESNTWGWTGSAVPMLQRRIDFFESILPFMQSVALLRQRQLIESRIESLHREMDVEKKHDFAGDY